jgi:hypothetical protein
MVEMTNREDQDPSSRCTVCGGVQWSFVRVGCDLYQPNDDAGFKLYRCLTCGQIMQNPLPTAAQLSRRTPPNMLPTGPHGKSRVGHYGRFFVSSRPRADCGAYGGMEQVTNC